MRWRSHYELMERSAKTLEKFEKKINKPRGLPLFRWHLQHLDTFITLSFRKQ